MTTLQITPPDTRETQKDMEAKAIAVSMKKSHDIILALMYLEELQ
jgi:hypothetical protein